MYLISAVTGRRLTLFSPLEGVIRATQPPALAHTRARAGTHTNTASARARTHTRQLERLTPALPQQTQHNALITAQSFQPGA